MRKRKRLWVLMYKKRRQAQGVDLRKVEKKRDYELRKTWMEGD